jgi:hypothetical protein
MFSLTSPNTTRTQSIPAGLLPGRDACDSSWQLVPAD